MENNLDSKDIYKISSSICSLEITFEKQKISTIGFLGILPLSDDENKIRGLIFNYHILK